jgi:hypothetical protein
MPTTFVIGVRTHNVTPEDLPGFARTFDLEDRIPHEAPVNVFAGYILGEQTWVISFPTVHVDIDTLHFIWDENLEDQAHTMRWVAHWQELFGGVCTGYQWSGTRSHTTLVGYNTIRLLHQMVQWKIESGAEDRAERLPWDLIH